MNILVVEDDPDILALLVNALEQAEHIVHAVSDGSAALAAIENHAPNVVVLDWMIPLVSGIEVCKRIKQSPSTADIQVIIVSARGDEDHKVLGLDAGADDYMGKPFSTRELVSRVNAAGRRVQRNHNQVIHIKNMTIDITGQLVKVDDEMLKIGPTELKMLTFFAKNQNRAFNRSQILDHVWGTNVYIDDRTVDVHIGRLRKLLTDAGFDNYIQTVRGIGYRFQVPSNQHAITPHT